MCDIKTRVSLEEIGGSTRRPSGFLETNNTFSGTAKNGLRLGLVHCNVLQPDTFHVVRFLRAVQQSCFFSRRYLRTSAQSELNSDELASACARNGLE
jgi:hypothetical protein